MQIKVPVEPADAGVFSRKSLHYMERAITSQIEKGRWKWWGL